MSTSDPKTLESKAEDEPSANSQTHTPGTSKERETTSTVNRGSTMDSPLLHEFPTIGTQPPAVVKTTGEGDGTYESASPEIRWSGLDLIDDEQGTDPQTTADEEETQLNSKRSVEQVTHGDSGTYSAKIEAPQIASPAEKTAYEAFFDSENADVEVDIRDTDVAKGKKVNRETWTGFEPGSASRLMVDLPDTLDDGKVSVVPSTALGGDETTLNVLERQETASTTYTQAQGSQLSRKGSGRRKIFITKATLRGWLRKIRLGGTGPVTELSDPGVTLSARTPKRPVSPESTPITQPTSNETAVGNDKSAPEFTSAPREIGDETMSHGITSTESAETVGLVQVPSNETIRPRNSDTSTGATQGTERGDRPIKGQYPATPRSVMEAGGSATEAQASASTQRSKPRPISLGTHARMWEGVVEGYAGSDDEQPDDYDEESDEDELPVRLQEALSAIPDDTPVPVDIQERLRLLAEATLGEDDEITVGIRNSLTLQLARDDMSAAVTQAHNSRTNGLSTLTNVTEIEDEEQDVEPNPNRQSNQSQVTEIYESE